MQSSRDKLNYKIYDDERIVNDRFWVFYGKSIDIS